MKVYRFDVDNFPKIDEKIILCLGFFDGLHIGHKKIISEAKKIVGKVGVLTFDNSVYNLKNNDDVLLTPSNMKISILEGLGIDYYFELKMNNRLLSTSKEVFIECLNKINPSVCVCGPDYTFGKNKEGNVDYLKQNFDTKIVPFEIVDNFKVSTRNIFLEISAGNFEKANKLLGRNYTISGIVAEGLKNGRKFGYPTANIRLDDNYFMPKEGVYFGIITIDGVRYDAIASYGTHPTVSKLPNPILEIHILNFNKDIYDKEVKFEFLKFHRDNMKFDSESELISQLNLDKKAAEKFF